MLPKGDIHSLKVWAYPRNGFIPSKNESHQIHLAEDS
jgi:hypothetical protein